MIKMLTFTVSVFVVFSVWYIHDTRNSGSATKPIEAEPAGAVVPYKAEGLPIPRMRWVSEEFEVTAYCAPCEICCKGANDGITASGYDVRERSVSHFVAAPARFPYGTVFRIPGYNSGRPVVVLDRGGAIKGRRLVVYIQDGHRAASKFGRRIITVQRRENNDGSENTQ